VILAHAGHWYHAILYMLPVIVISVALWRSGAREERERKARAERAERPEGAAIGDGDPGEDGGGG
jgi:hypothetical protein